MTGNPSELQKALRSAAQAYCDVLCTIVPAGRERALAITKLDECVMWASAGLLPQGDDPCTK